MILRFSGLSLVVICLEHPRRLATLLFPGHPKFCQIINAPRLRYPQLFRMVGDKLAELETFLFSRSIPIGLIFGIERVCAYVWNCIHHKSNYFGGKLYIRSLNNLEQPTSCYFSIVLKSKKVSLHQLNSKERYSCVI